MNSDEKTFSRTLFQNKIYRFEGRSFQTLFEEIMSFADSDFRRIKSWGSTGDQKNDGYIPSKGIYYQVHAPEEPQSKYPEAIRKLENDLEGLLTHWNNVREFYFVFNDKFNGVEPNSEKKLASLKEKYKLHKCGIITANDLQNTLFKLEDDQIVSIVGFLPDVSSINSLDYKVIDEVVGFIINLGFEAYTEIRYPLWDKKITFNFSSAKTKQVLDYNSQFLGQLERFLSKDTQLEHLLQLYLTGAYSSILSEWEGYGYSGDNVFWELVKRCSPKEGKAYIDAVITIIAKYFESCDIFEDTSEE